MKRLKGKTKSIVFANAMWGALRRLPIWARTHILDSSARLSEIMEKYGPDFACKATCLRQFFPRIPRKLLQKTFDIISDMQSSGKHIFNLGHGIRPDAKLENVEAMCETVKNFKA
ncbi:MAG: uroporphyrinogen decarboxylase family protein [Bacilli bacterium]